MPIFDFQCNKCDNREEKLVSSSIIETPCPKCTQGTMYKQHTPTATPTIFKGKGWFKTSGQY